MKRRLSAALGCIAVCSALVAACGRAADEPAGETAPAASPRESLLEVAMPDFARMDASVQAQAREREALVAQKRADRSASDAELGAAYGQLGMLLHAAEFFDAAEPAYLNAQTLQPSAMQWPYYLGHLYRTEGSTAKSIEAFSRALELTPDDHAALVWLGRTYLEQGQPEKAEPLFERAAAIPPRSAASVAGLGQAALARRDYARAVERLQEALTIDPRLASIHSPLGMAYRGLGDQARAEQHLKQWRNTDLPVADPLMEAVSVSLHSGLSYELRGVAALDERDFTGAAALFRQGIELTPGTTSLGRSLRHKLGTALALSGDLDGAITQFEEVVRLAPPDARDEPAAKAHYSLGIILAGGDRTAEAVRHLQRAVGYNPNYVEARVALADALRRAGQVEASLAQYAEAVRLSPQAADARFGYAMGLIRLERFVEARDWLSESVRVQPDRPELAHALARVLAAAPDARARDGQRAAMLIKQLFQQYKSIEVGETMAMTLAELGDFAQAAAIQRGVLEAAKGAGRTRDVRRLTANLRLYERGQPCRTPWSADDPVHAPGPGGSASAAAIS